jgi:hypothetical protein
MEEDEPTTPAGCAWKVEEEAQRIEATKQEAVDMLNLYTFIRSGDYLDDFLPADQSGCGTGDQSEASTVDHSITGQYECQEYGANMNPWHYVTITHEGENVFTWTNTADYSWSLTQDASDPTLFNVG